jgi:hypothetical protein|tara:strand:- start:300 stop:515 length:216 start_codon:yes stop_codon:yes gene_type:complete
MKTKNKILQEIFNNDPMGILDKEFTTKDKLYMLRQEIEDLVELGPDYAHFMNASISYKSLKQIQKLLRKVG